MVEYLTIFPYVVIDGSRDIRFVPPEIELASIGFANGYFCKDVAGAPIPARAGRRVGYSHVLDAGIVAICRLFDEAEDLNAQMLTDFGAGGRQVVRGVDRAEMLVAVERRIGQVIEDASLEVQRAAFDLDPLAAFVRIVDGLLDPGDWPAFSAWQIWAQSVLTSPDMASCYPPGVFVSKTQKFEEQALKTIEVSAQVTARVADHAQAVILATVELAMLFDVRAALESWVEGD